MFLDFYLKKMAPDISFEILGTDIDSESVDFAKNGVYSRKEIKEAPLAYLSDHWARGTGSIADFVKAKDSLRIRTRWNMFNLLKFPQNFNEMFDIIFCRNVYIYFNADQIKQSTKQLMLHLHKHGHLFVGISESLTGLNLPINSVGPSIYRHLEQGQNPNDKKSNLGFNSNLHLVKTSATTPKSGIPDFKIGTTATNIFTTLNTTSTVAPTIKEVLTVVCVDDSPSIITLLKKILSTEEGFQVVATAANGLEAQAKIKEFKPDIVTMDIHMPEQTGIEYLAANYKENHPPVIIVSSVSREDSELAIKTLSLGASDYVEKPSFSNLTEMGDEIRRKLRSAYRNQVQYKNTLEISLDKSFKKCIKISNPEKCLRVILGTLSDKKRIISLVNEFGVSQIATFILLDAKNIQEHQLSKDLPLKCELISNWPSQINKDGFYIAEANSMLNKISKHFKDLQTSIMIFGEISTKLEPLIKEWQTRQILIEDLGTKRNGKNHLKAIANDVVPATSFAYMSSEYLGKKS
jgi:chemotaxis protein methyltransferase CheR